MTQDLQRADLVPSPLGLVGCYEANAGCEIAPKETIVFDQLSPVDTATTKHLCRLKGGDIINALARDSGRPQGLGHCHDVLQIIHLVVRAMKHMYATCCSLAGVYLIKGMIRGMPGSGWAGLRPASHWGQLSVPDIHELVFQRMHPGLTDNEDPMLTLFARRVSFRGR